MFYTPFKRRGQVEKATRLVPTLDFCVVTFPQTYEDRLQVAGLALQLDTSYQESRHKRIKGVVESVPSKLSRTTLRIKDPGHPAPKREISADFIQSMNAYGPRWSRADYSLAGYVPEFHYLSDIEMNVLPGDTVYVDYTALQEENIIAQEKDAVSYKVRYDNLICAVRDGKTIMVGGYTLVMPLTQTKEELEYPVRDQAGNMVLGKDGKPLMIVVGTELKAKYLLGIMQVIRPDNPYGLAPGDKIMYQPNADWLNQIEGLETYAIKEEDLLAKITIMKDNKPKINPLGNRVVIRVPEAAEKTKGGIIIPESAKVRPLEGIVYEVGPEVKGFGPGDHVLYAQGAGAELTFQDQLMLIMRETDVFAVIENVR